MPLLNDEVQATIKADPEADPPTNKKSIGPVPIIASAALAPESATSVQPQSLCKAACKSLKRDPLYYHPTLAASRLFDKVLFTPDASALPSPQGSKTGSADLEFSKVTADRVNSRDKASEAIGEHSDVTSTEGVSHAEHLMREGVQGNPLPMNQSRYEGSDPGLDRHGTPLVITEHDYWLRALNLAPIYTLADAFDAYSRLVGVTKSVPSAKGLASE